jgi:hypothetical protein
MSDIHKEMTAWRKHLRECRERDEQSKEAKQ